jgi:hypothetical protein
MMTGQYRDPVRVVGFNTSEGWSRDVSEDVAWEFLSDFGLTANQSLPKHANF